jgi:excisionase family DNA binding protein
MSSPNDEQILKELRQIRRLMGAGQKRLLTVDEAAASLGISPKTIRNRLSSGNFPIKSVKLAGRTLFKVSDIDALVDRLGEN